MAYVNIKEASHTDLYYHYQRQILQGDHICLYKFQFLVVQLSWNALWSYNI